MPVYTEELLEQYIEKAIFDRQNKNRYPFIIFDKTQNAYAGSTSFMNISNTDSRLEIGSTWIGHEFQKTGLNRNCKYLMLSFAFDTLYAERLEFRTDERNVKSRAAIEKIGGQYEGMLRSHTIMPDGFRRNTVCYSILKNEWTEIKNNKIKQ
jgi:N-acetyltransferase